MRIAVVAPSRTLPRDAAGVLAALAKPDGTEVEIRPQCFLSDGHFAGSDEERAEAFAAAANDPGVDAVWFARGGYGSCRLLTRILPRLGAVAREKAYVGYSDAGFLLAALHVNGIGRPVHGPMVADACRDGGEDALRRVLGFLSGDEGREPHTDEEPSLAFNLAILASLVSGPYLPDLKGKVLQVEEVSEHLYAIDRNLFTIVSSGRLAGAAGLRLGRVSDVPENDVAFGEEAEAIVRRWAALAGVPYLGRADIGHDAGNKMVPFA